ncbi:quinone oxidoreductase family protein [Novosphingobium aerophilum]|uniref:Zinc-binding alcohol dehydrogenase family protein n=1 Tax=Novosphingobium aerophilum TaxID=2839843 RepID=A0A7X1FB60_9SPHN|nr:zinc-binding alcohol dehydrogenase family protein [Novosphingobium aerophilum]MBC2653514.1 zinc-binding alcohol dehydrogenase family protein [Novosphingobium aerophilum]
MNDIPSTMRAVRLDQVGGPENLAVVDVPTPAVGPHDVLIKTALAGLTYGDTEARRGTYFSTTVLPHYPGREVAGTVVAVGDSVTGIAVGDRVMALVVSGACCAEYVAAPTVPTTTKDGRSYPPADITRIPDSVSFECALPYIVNYRLAHFLFEGSSKVPKGATVLVHGASGGMGSMVMQLGEAKGCHVIATCRTAQEEEFCRKLGAAEVIRVDTEDYVAKVLTLTSGRGVDFSFNGVGGETLNRDFEVMAPFGEIQAYGYVAGKTLFDVFRIGKTIAIKTFAADDFFPTPMLPAATQAMLNLFECGPLYAAEMIFPMSEVVEANRLLDRGGVIGKVALRP